MNANMTTDSVPNIAWIPLTATTAVVRQAIVWLQSTIRVLVSILKRTKPKHLSHCSYIVEQSLALEIEEF